jgi:hypothetical protein
MPHDPQVSSDLIRVVGEICGVPAQLLSSAELRLWARIDRLERHAVHERLWTHRALVNLWAMRGTLIGCRQQGWACGSPPEAEAERFAEFLGGQLSTRWEAHSSAPVGFSPAKRSSGRVRRQGGNVGQRPIR